MLLLILSLALQQQIVHSFVEVSSTFYQGVVSFLGGIRGIDDQESLHLVAHVWVDDIVDLEGGFQSGSRRLVLLNWHGS